MGTKTRRNSAIGFTILMIFFSVLVSQVAATGNELNLPSTPVTLEVIYPGTVSYFNTTLSEVSSGYDVTNGTYLGWCIDTATEMAPSPATHEVTLYSSLNPPGSLTAYNWTMVNYVLNHKQGTFWDVQDAIWYFVDIDGGYIPPLNNTAAWNMINDALANGTGFIPTNDQTIAVICFPETVLPGSPSVQISIIEVTTPVVPEFPQFLILPLFMIATLLGVIAYRRKHPPTPTR
jgi:hypothetical protein